MLMDIRMPDLDGIEATSMIMPADASGPSGDHPDHVRRGRLRLWLAQAGASGFLVKDMALDDILTARPGRGGGDALISPSVTRRLIEEFAALPGRTARNRSAASRLTEREREVLALVGRGLSNAEIATELGISAAPRKRTWPGCSAKLDARDRVQLVIIAYETGVVAPSG